MGKGKKQKWFCGMAAVAVIVVLAAAWMIGEANRKMEAELNAFRYERPVPIYGAEENGEVLQLLQEQADRNRMDAAEKNENVCVYYSLTGKIIHKEVFDLFLDSVEQGTEDAVILMESDWEGCVDIHYISYRDEEFFYVLDSGDRYENEEPVMRCFEYGKVSEGAICLSVSEDENELAAWDEAWTKEAEEMSKAYADEEISWEEYQARLTDRRERAKERPYVWIWVSEESFM